VAGSLRIIIDGACDGAANMARDAALLDEHRPGDPPVLRLYRWRPPAVSYGYHQGVEGFDADAIAAAGFGLVRRPTGGRAILHADELTYAVVGASPSPLFGESLHATYTRINEALLRFLRDLGLAADVSGGESREDARGMVCFKSAGRHEIHVQGRKLVGSAQRRHGGVFLQHGSILAGPGHLELPRFLLPAPGRPAPDRAQLSLVTTDLGQLMGVRLDDAGQERLLPRLADAFCWAWGLEPG
jgi:lipoate-protein ligase A